MPRGVTPDPHLTRGVGGDGNGLNYVHTDREPGNARIAEAVSFQPGAAVEEDTVRCIFVGVESA
jgi:hypothetical protein